MGVWLASLRWRHRVLAELVGNLWMESGPDCLCKEVAGRVGGRCGSLVDPRRGGHRCDMGSPVTSCLGLPPAAACPPSLVCLMLQHASGQPPTPPRRPPHAVLPSLGESEEGPLCRQRCRFPPREAQSHRWAGWSYDAARVHGSQALAP